MYFSLWQHSSSRSTYCQLRVHRLLGLLVVAECSSLPCICLLRNWIYGNWEKYALFCAYPSLILSLVFISPIELVICKTTAVQLLRWLNHSCCKSPG